MQSSFGGAAGGVGYLELKIPSSHCTGSRRRNLYWEQTTVGDGERDAGTESDSSTGDVYPPSERGCVVAVCSFHPSNKQSLHSIISSVFLTEIELPPRSSHLDSAPKDGRKQQTYQVDGLPRTSSWTLSMLPAHTLQKRLWCVIQIKIDCNACNMCKTNVMYVMYM